MFPALQPISPSAIAAQSSVTPDMLGIRAAQVAVIRAERDEDIVAQGDEAGYCYLVVSGCVRTVRPMEDGRRQVGAFLFVGDLFGWEALDEYDVGIEAVTPVTLRRYLSRRPAAPRNRRA